jgi:hypothetical protein
MLQTHTQHDVLVEALTAFLEYLTNHPVVDPNLKNNLTYVNDDLCDAEWFTQHFPDNLDISCAYATLQQCRLYK